MGEGIGAGNGGTGAGVGGDGGTGAAGSGGVGAAGAGGAAAGAGGTQSGEGAGAAGAGSGQGTASGTGEGQQQQFDAEYVKGIRDEAAKARTELRALQAKLAAFENANLSEAEKTAKRVQELETVNARLVAEQRISAVQVAAQKAGAVHPEVVSRLVGPEVDDVNAEMQRLKKQYPALFTIKPAGSADGGARETPPAKKDMNSFIRASAGR